MIQLVEGLNVYSLHKKVPKKYSHLKEKYKMTFILGALKRWRSGHKFSVDFDRTVLALGQWHFVDLGVAEVTLQELVHSIMEKWCFSNLPKNENIYFHRFINIIRVELGEDDWTRCLYYLTESSDVILRSNILEYCEYNKKQDEIELIIS